MISCPTRSADLLPSMVGHYTSNRSAKRSHICGISFVRHVHYRRVSRGERKGGPGRSAEENKALVERFVEEFRNKGNLSAADELMAPDAQIHLPTGDVVNPDEAKGFATMWRESFPDWHSTFRSWS